MSDETTADNVVDLPGSGSDFEKRWDDIVNTLSGLGGEQDKDAANRVGEPYILMDTDLEVLYRFNHYVGRIIDSPPNECTRRGWEIESELDEDPFQTEFAKLDLVQKLADADRWGRLYGGGAIILGIEDGVEPDKPVNPNTIRKIAYARVVDKKELTPLTFFVDFDDPRFGEPDVYQLTPRQAQGIHAGVPVRIHADRVIRFDGVRLPKALELLNNSWGDSVVQRTWNALARLGVGEKAIGILLQELSLAIWKMQGLADVLSGPNGQELFMRRIVAANISKSVCRAMVIDAENEDFGRVSAKLSGAANLYDRLAQSLASAAEMPMTLLFGQSPGGLSTDDKSGRINWYDTMASRQVKAYEPHIRHLVDLMMLAKEGPTKGKVIEYDVAFRPLYEPTEEEQSATRKQQAETDHIYIEDQVLDPREVRQSRFSGQYSLETSLEEPGEPPVVTKPEEE